MEGYKKKKKNKCNDQKYIHPPPQNFTKTEHPNILPSLQLALARVLQLICLHLALNCF